MEKEVFISVTLANGTIIENVSSKYLYKAGLRTCYIPPAVFNETVHLIQESWAEIMVLLAQARKIGYIELPL
jgi:hypothetical protein